MSRYKIARERFINPYNFVSIDHAVTRGAVSYGPLSGTIACELETLTPLFIPNTTKGNAFSTNVAHSYDFFSYEDLTKRTDYRQNPARPVIPGSSLRGAIRSAYEAVVNGCMSSCDNENTLYRRTPVPRKNYGIIEKDRETGERVLYKATKSKLPVQDRGTHQTGETLRGGIYLRGENFSFGATPKKSDAIMHYERDAKGDPIEIARFTENSREWQNLMEVWRLYQRKEGTIRGVNQNNQHRGYKGYLLADPLPVYYTKLDNGDFYYFSPAAITKEVFSRTLKDLLQAQGGHNPCTDGGNLCPACALFGMTGDASRASRLMFRDAVPIAPEDAMWSPWYDTVRILPILSMPKVSATEFYMEDVPGAAYYNYDYVVHYYRGAARQRQYAPVRTFLENPQLRGRKMYWHRKTPALDNTNNFPAQRMEIRPVKREKSFKFELCFDRLTQDELETLLWVLTFGSHAKTHAHKLGHGKPVGYGSVRITKTEVTLVRLKEDFSLAETPGEFTPKPPAHTPALSEYLAMTDFSKATDDVKYPIADNGRNQGTYVWFGINKEILYGGFNPSFHHTLPKPLDEDVALPQYEAGDGDIGGNRKAVVFAVQPEQDPSAVPPTPRATAAPTAVSNAVGATIGDALVARKAEKAKKPDYDRRQLKIALGNYAFNPKARKLLENFLRDYEADPEGYRDFEQTYESVKRKLAP